MGGGGTAETKRTVKDSSWSLFKTCSVRSYSQPAPAWRLNDAQPASQPARPRIPGAGTRPPATEPFQTEAFLNWVWGGERGRETDYSPNGLAPQGKATFFSAGKTRGDPRLATQIEMGLPLVCDRPPSSQAEGLLSEMPASGPRRERAAAGYRALAPFPGAGRDALPFLLGEAAQP